MNPNHKYYKFERGNTRKLMKAKAASSSCKQRNYTFPSKGLVKSVLYDLRHNNRPSVIIISVPGLDKDTILSQWPD